MRKGENLDAYKKMETCEDRQEVPLVWTKYGNEPMERLKLVASHQTVRSPNGVPLQVALELQYFDLQSGELVRNDRHVMELEGLSLGAILAPMG